MRFQKLSTILALALTFGACADQADPGRLLEPTQEASESRSWEADRIALANGQAPEFEEAGAFVEKTIGRNGGYLYLDLHYLYVPKGAVTRPTVFRMTTFGNGRVGADLTATTVGSNRENDVGERGFKRPVYITFSYAFAQNQPSHPSHVKVYWLRPDGQLEAQPTYVHSEYQAATGVLKHFSPYAVGWPE